MKKIRLDVESLEVTSFDTEQLPERRGTVRGAQTMFGGWCAEDQDPFTAAPPCTLKVYSDEEPSC
jgi:hypothetical protein